MDKKHIEDFAAVPQPPRETMGFLEDLKAPLCYQFRGKDGCLAGDTAGCMDSGANIVMEFPDPGNILETAYASLRRVLKARKIAESCSVPLIICHKDQQMDVRNISWKAVPVK